MIWEDLKFYKPIEKAELSEAKKSIENIIAERLASHGFKKLGKKLIRKSNDLIHIIHLDTRGSWMGSSKSLKIEIAIVSIFDTDILVDNFEPISGSYIQDLEPKLKNYYQITKEYNLFAEFLSRKIIDIVLPYFDKYSNSKDVLKNGINIGETKNLKLFCDLTNQSNEEQLQLKKEAVFKRLKLKD